MTNFLLIFLTLVAAVAAGLGRALWRQRKPASPFLPPDWQSVVSRNPVLETYAPLNRLFRNEDFAFLTAQRDLRRQLRRQRRNILRLYLKQLRADFENVYRVCRLLAVTANEPGFAARITRRALRIHSLLLILRLRCWLGWTGSVAEQATSLVEAFSRFDISVRALAPALSASSQEA